MLVGLFVARTAVLPVVLWDGRSIWLFHAKKLFFEGMITNKVLLAPENYWSLPDKPLLLPAWLASFTAFSPSYNVQPVRTYSYPS